MARVTQPDEKVVETWEITTEGTVWVWVYDKREDRYRKQRVGGRQGGSKRLHISRDDRRFNQEQIVFEMKDRDPFTNGSLCLLSEDRPDDLDTKYHMTPEDLRAILDIKDEALFRSEVTEIKSELILRRLVDLGEKHATVAQLEFIKELVDERYRVGGTQRTVEEMLQAGERLSGTVLS